MQAAQLNQLVHDDAGLGQAERLKIGARLEMSCGDAKAAHRERGRVVGSRGQPRRQDCDDGDLARALGKSV